MNSKSIKNEVEYILKLLGKSNVEHVVIDGWNGETILGSDIDILVKKKNFYKALEIVSKEGYVVKSIKPNINFFFKESYADKNNIRLHLTTGLVFGKPIRFLPVPFAKRLLDKKVYYNGYYIIHKKFKWIKILKEISEIPHNIVRFFVKILKP